MAVEVRKYVTFIEEIHQEGGRALDRPLRKVAVAAVLKNPYAGAWSEDISELIDAGAWLATALMERAKAALGEPVESYGKGGIVGEAGETEHVAALLHPKFGAPISSDPAAKRQRRAHQQAQQEPEHRALPQSQPALTCG